MIVTMQLIRFRAMPDEIVAVVHLDTTKTVTIAQPNGTPTVESDPLYILTCRFDRNAEGLSGTALRAWIIDEVRRLSRVALAAILRSQISIDGGTALPGEGQTL